MKLSSFLLVIAFLFALAVRADDDHDRKPSAPPPTRSQAPGAQHQNEQAGCTASPQKLVDFANGERFDLGAQVGYIAGSACAPYRAALRDAALAAGAEFAQSGPFRLEAFAQQVKKGGKQVASVETTLAKTIPDILRENPLSSSEMLPLLGQLSLLSPQAARHVLVALIRQETSDADQKLNVAKADLKPGIAAELAASLLNLGVLEPVVASDLSEAIGEMALTSQGDSLARFFRGLGAAAGVESALAPTFNLSAAALKQGVKKGGKFFNKSQQDSLTLAVFEALRAAAGQGLLEPGTSELNQALDALVQGKSVTLTALRRLWREAVRVLAETQNQTALAEAISASLTPQMVFLKADLRDLLLKAGASYPAVASSVQQNIVTAWGRAWNQLNHQGLSVGEFNRIKTAYFEPWVERVLDFPPASVQANWVRAVYDWGLVNDAVVEKKMPRLFLGTLQRPDRGPASTGSVPEDQVRMLTDSFALVWRLHHAYLPILDRWVKKNE